MLGLKNIIDMYMYIYIYMEETYLKMVMRPSELYSNCWLSFLIFLLCCEFLEGKKIALSLLLIKCLINIERTNGSWLLVRKTQQL